MGSINVQTVVFSATLSANATSGFWYWNNPLIDRVYTFSAVPQGLGQPGLTWFTAEITDVGNSMMAPPTKRRIQYRVKNPNPFAIAYEVHMSVAAP